MINGRRDTYDIIAEAVREYWKKKGSQDVIVFFEQKYDSPYSEWVKMEELIESEGMESDRIIFHNDFCEGHMLARNIHVIPLWVVLRHYRKKVIENGQIH